MVIINNLRFTVLDSAGIPLPEYDNPFQSEEDMRNGVASCYVETPPPTAPQNFTIQINAIQPLNYKKTLGYYFDFYADGVRSAHGTTIGQFRSSRKGDDKQIIIDCFHEIDDGGQNYIDKELMFNPIDKNKDDASLAAMRRTADSGRFSLQDVGSIKLKFAEILETHRDRPGTKQHRPTKLGAIDGEVNEKALKGNSSSHCIGGGKTLAVKSANRDSLIKTAKTFTEVKILYRSRDALQNIGIIKRNPKPKVETDVVGRRAKPKSEVITIDGSDDEAPPTPLTRALKSERGVKRERVGSGTIKPEKKVKKEAPVIVDMTGDD